MASSYEKFPIVIVDDNQHTLSVLESFLTHKGYTNLAVFSDSQKASRYLEQHDAAMAILDLNMPNMSGQLLLEQMSEKKPHIPVIIVTGESQIETAVECMRIGAADFLTKPISFNRLATSIKRALELRDLNEELLSLGNASPADLQAVSSHFSSIITRNSGMLSLLRYVEVIADYMQPILVAGETGVGKELFARAIHGLSKRKGPFVSVNVAGLDDQMFSDTLFGHKKGAYTGALQDRDGLVAKAAHGTLFLDEIGDLNESAQIKLLRLLQENEFYPLGSDVPVQSLARLVVATNRNLKLSVTEGKFRKDLYYRLCSHQVIIPPLRNRTDDIPLLLDHFIAEAAKAMKKGKPSYRKELIDYLNLYDFPGNVRELQAMVIDVVARTGTSKITVQSFKEFINRERETASTDLPTIDAHAVTFDRFPTLKDAETELIRRALEIAKGNQGIAAQLLGITRQALNNRLRRNA